MILINMWLLSIVISHQTLELHARNAISNENNRQKFYEGGYNGEDNPSIDGFERTHRTHKYQMMSRKVAAAPPDVVNRRSSSGGRMYDLSTKPTMLYERVYTTAGLRAEPPGSRDVKPVKRFHAAVSDEHGNTQSTAVRPKDEVPNNGPTTTSCLYSPGSRSLSFASSPDPSPKESTTANQPEEQFTSVMDNDVSSSFSSPKPLTSATSVMASNACSGRHETDAKNDDGESGRSTTSLPSTSTAGRKPENVFRRRYPNSFTAITVGGPDGQRIFYHRTGSTNRHQYPHMGRCNRHRYRVESATVPPSIKPGRSFRIFDHAKVDRSTDDAKDDGTTTEPPTKDDGSTAEPTRDDGSTAEPTKVPSKSGLLGSVCSTCSKPVNPTYTFVQAKPYITTSIPTRPRTQTLITVYEPMLVTRHYNTYHNV